MLLSKLSRFRVMLLVPLNRSRRKRDVVRLSELVRQLGRIRHLVSPALNYGLVRLSLSDVRTRDRLPHLRMITWLVRLLRNCRNVGWMLATMLVLSMVVPLLILSTSMSYFGPLGPDEFLVHSV